MSDRNDLTIFSLLIAVLAFIIACASLVNTFSGSYEDLSDSPDLFEVGDIPVVDLQHGLCLWLPFDDSLNDRSGYGNDVVDYYGSVFSSGYFADSVCFNGTNYVYLDSSPVGLGVNVVSLSMWVNLEQNGTEIGRSQQFFTSNDWWGSIFVEYSSINKLYFRMGNSSSHTTIGSSYDIVDFTGWSHLLFVGVSGEYMSYYVNGTLVCYKDVSVTWETLDFNKIKLGMLNSGLGLVGCVDDMRLYNRVLSEYEINALYNLGD